MLAVKKKMLFLICSEEIGKTLLLFCLYHYAVVLAAAIWKAAAEESLSLCIKINQLISQSLVRHRNYDHIIISNCFCLLISSMQ